MLITHHVYIHCSLNVFNCWCFCFRIKMCFSGNLHNWNILWEASAGTVPIATCMHLVCCLWVVLGTSSTSDHECESESSPEPENQYLQWVEKNRQEVKDKLSEIICNSMLCHKKTGVLSPVQTLNVDKNPNSWVIESTKVLLMVATFYWVKPRII